MGDRIGKIESKKQGSLSALSHRVREYIPPHPPPSRLTGGAQWAVEDFQQQAASIAGQLVSELRELDEKGELTKEEREASAGIREGSSNRRDEAEER